MSTTKRKSALEEKYVEVGGYLIHPNMIRNNFLNLPPDMLFRLQEEGYYLTRKGGMRNSKLRCMSLDPVDIEKYKEEHS